MWREGTSKTVLTAILSERLTKIAAQGWEDRQRRGTISKSDVGTKYGGLFDAIREV
jgi:hypothetical protein